jgi:hypothetical protein
MAEERPIVVARVAFKTDGTFAFVDPTHPLPISIIAGSLIPIAKADIFNTALPAAEAAWLGADIAPTNSPSYLRIHVAVAAAGVLRVARTVGGVTVVENLNAGVPLVANSAYSFVVEWRTGDSINFRYSVTGANILVFRANEIGGAI